MARLAIKGHETRGTEVIALLEMLGGINVDNLDGDDMYYYYYITDDKVIDSVLFKYSDDKARIFSLEEFEEKYPYKVGDKVQYKGSTSCGSVFEVEKMRWEEYTVKYTLCLFGCNNYKRSTLPAEYLQPYKEETMEERKYNVEKYLKVWDAAEKGLEVFVNDNFELKEDNGKFYIVKKQPQYPKTYEECCKVLGYEPYRQSVTGYHSELIEKFQQLLICRDAYWLLAGEQMGLGKPWKPDYTNDDVKFCICCCANLVVDGITYETNQVLTFPTKEMRVAFLENFKELIEICKELL